MPAHAAGRVRARIAMRSEVACMVVFVCQVRRIEGPAVGTASLVAAMYQDRCPGALFCKGHRKMRSVVSRDGRARANCQQLS